MKRQMKIVAVVSATALLAIGDETSYFDGEDRILRGWVVLVDGEYVEIDNDNVYEKAFSRIGSGFRKTVHYTSRQQRLLLTL